MSSSLSHTQNTSLYSVLTPPGLFTLWFIEMKTFSSLGVTGRTPRYKACQCVDSQPWILNMISGWTRRVKLQLAVKTVTSWCKWEDEIWYTCVCAVAAGESQEVCECVVCKFDSFQQLLYKTNFPKINLVESIFYSRRWKNSWYSFHFLQMAAQPAAHIHTLRTDWLYV